jgi:hypothetical protein
VRQQAVTKKETRLQRDSLRAQEEEADEDEENKSEEKADDDDDLGELGDEVNAD